MHTFKIDTTIVFGRASEFAFTEASHITDIFGRQIPWQTFNTEVTKHLQIKKTLNSIAEKNAYQRQLGLVLVDLVREHVIRRNKELGIHGNGLSILTSFQTVLLALTCGMLEEAAELIEEITPDELFDEEILKNFADACRSGIHL